jgi:hypothetical protein
MEKIEIPSLVTLEIKPELTEKPLVKIQFQGVKPVVHEEEVDEDIESKKSAFKIVNKRRGPQYREDVFKRLALQNIRTGYVDIASELKEQKRTVIEEEKEEKVASKKQEEEEPQKIVKKLVIRNVEFKLPEKKVEEKKEDSDSEEKERPKKQPSEEKEETEKLPSSASEEEAELEEEGLRRLVEATETSAEVVEEVTEKPKRGRKPKKGKTEAEPELPVDLTTAIIEKMKVTDRLPKEREKRILATSSFYMNNRKLFIQKLSELFKNYRQDLLKTDEDVSCESRSSSDFDLLTHQKVVRDYLNLYTPYRGLLIYHGLGAGKCHAKGTRLLPHATP